MTESGESLFSRYAGDVRLRVSLRDLVEECRPKGLRATGKSSLLCCSPLREDRHPSFSVFESGGEYIAFDHATRESFDLFAFVMKREGLDFAGAVRWCGDRAGLPWDDYKKQHGGEGGRPARPPEFTEAEWDRAIEEVMLLDERQAVAAVQQAMVDLCHSFFVHSDKLVAYVEGRWGISPETQRRFMLGYVPDGFAGLLGTLREEGVFPYDKKQLVKTGWFLARGRIPDDPNPDLRCIFDGRLLYPYLWRGKCRYACARILFEERIDRAYFEAHPWEEAKFKKALVGGPSHPSVSPYVQNDLLYNADNAVRSRTGFARLVIVEGPSDCMAFVEAGYDCVAPVATSIRSEDVPMLLEACSRYREIVLATDTDVKPDGRRPGLEGALRMAPDLLKAEKRVRLLVFPLPPGEAKVDPASWSLAWKRAGKEGDPFAELVAGAPSVAEALVQFLDPSVSAADLPTALEAVTRFARAGSFSKAQFEELAVQVRERLRGRFSKSAVKQAMGEVDDKIEAEERARTAQDTDDKESLQIEGLVLERGGHDQPGKVRCYQGYARDGSPTVVSTFILQPSRIIVASLGERLLECSVHIETGTTLLDRWVVPKKAWSSRREFVSAFPHERMQFTGSDHNVHAVYQIVSERAHRLGVPTVRGESVVGIHRTAHGLRLVLPTETWDENGPMTSPDIVYATDTGSVPFCSMIKVDGQQQPADVDALATRLIPLLFELNDPIKVTTICAWTVGCYFLPEIRELNGGKAVVLNVFGSPQSGKCLAPGTLVLRYSGAVVPVESIRVGDLLMGPDSTPRRVLGTNKGHGPMRRIIPNKGDPWECNDVHILTLVQTDSGEIRDMAVGEWESMKPWCRERWKLFIPERVDFPMLEDELPVDPYFLGAWIGDGTKSLRKDRLLLTVAITKPDIEIVQTCEAVALAHGVRVYSHYRSPNNPTHHLTHPDGNRKNKNKLLEAMRNLWPTGYDGSIPQPYLFASRKDRLQLLAGILDTDGDSHYGGFNISQKNRRTADGIAFLARSLGLRVTEKDTFFEGIKHKREPSENTVTYRRLAIFGDCSIVPTRISRKQVAPRRKGTDARRTGFTVEHLADGDFFGFELDGDGRFLLGDFTVTHNTSLVHRIVNRMLQPYGPSFKPATPAETKFATIRNLSWSNCFISPFDEYRTAEAGADFVRLLRTGFSGGVEGRGARDQTMRGYDLCGAVEVTGEQRADVDAAMGDRLVMVGFDQNRINVRETPAALLELEAAEERWRMATDLLQWRMRIHAPTVRQWWAEAKTAALGALERIGVQVPPRTRDGCGELAFRLRAWTEWLDHRAERAMGGVPRPPLDQVLRQMLETTTGLEIPETGVRGTVVPIAGKNLVVRALEAVTPYATQGIFEDRKCYRLAIRDFRRMLVVHPGSLAATLAKESRTRGKPDPTNGEEALRAAAREEFAKEGAAGWLVDPSFPYRMGSADDVGDEEGRTKRMRCWLIDIERAHERVGLELDWPGTPATWGGDRRTTVTSLPMWKKVPPGSEIV